MAALPEPERQSERHFGTRPEQHNPNLRLVPDGEAIQVRDRTFRACIYDSQNPISMADAQQLSALFSAVYGDHYINPLFTNPARSRFAIEKGEWIAIVLKDESGSIVAHGGVLPQARGMYELGRTLVHPDGRGCGLSKVLNALRQKHIESTETAANPATVFTQAVTTHPITQRTLQDGSFGLIPTGLLFSKYPDVFQAGHRESVLHLSRVYDENLKEEKDVYVPKEYRNMIRIMYQSLGCQRRLRASNPFRTKRLRHSDKTSITAEDNILVVQPASTKRSKVLVQAIESAAIDSDIEFCSVEVPIECPGAPGLIRQLRKNGFIFGALEVSRDGDILIMQRPRVMPQASEIQLYGLEAKLLDHQLRNEAA